MSINYKDGYVTVSDFKANRPDLSVHTNNAIQAAIYQACAMLNSHTDGKIKSVWDYTNNSENPETTNELYRTENELEYISEAIILQTQYIINLGNDLTVGSGSYSLGGVTYSDSTPSSRETIAPGVNQILSKARVYSFFAMGTGENTPDGVGDTFIPDKTSYNKFTIAQLDARYQLAHPILSDAQGKIATIQQGDGTTTSIVWTDPPTVDLQNYYTMSQVNDAIQSFWNTNIIPYAGIEWCNSTFVKQNDYNQKIQTIDTTLQNNYNSIYSNTTSISSLNNRVTTLENESGSGIDLSQYITQNQLQEQLENYLTTATANNTYYTKQSIDNTFRNYLPLTGGSLTGSLTIKQPSGNAGVVTNTSSWNNQNFVSTKYTTNVNNVNDSTTKLKIEANLTGNTSSIIGKNLTIKGLVTPTENDQAATKQYVDNAIAAGGGGGGSGGTTPDLSNYVTTTQLNTALNDYVSNSNLTTQLANYLTTTNANNNYASKTSPSINVSSSNPIRVLTPARNSGYIEFVRNNSNAGYIGLGSSSNNSLMLGCRNGSVKLEPSNNLIDASSSRVVNVNTPVAPNDAATKQYVDNAVANNSSQIYYYKLNFRTSILTLNASPTSPITYNISGYSTTGNVSLSQIKIISYALSSAPNQVQASLIVSNFGGIDNNKIVISNPISSSSFSLTLVGISSTQIANSGTPVTASTRATTLLSLDNEPEEEGVLKLISIERINI